MCKQLQTIQSGFILLLLVCSLANAQEAHVKPSQIESLVREYAFKTNPTLNPDVEFKISEVAVDGIFEKLNFKIFLVESYVDNKSTGDVFNLISHNDQLIPFAELFGSNGLTSAAMLDDKLFFTFSWGSGIHRSHVGLLSVENSRIVIKYSGGFKETNLVVKKQNNSIAIESRPLRKIDSCMPGEFSCMIKETPNSLILFNESDSIVKPNFPAINVESHQLIAPK